MFLLTIYKNNKLILIVSWIVVVLWMILIFYLSSQPAVDSNKLSKGVTEVVVEALQKVAPNADLNNSKFNNVLRKNAHFFNYLILGLLITNALGESGIDRKKCILIAFSICIIYSITDELHQILVPGRGAQIKDVALDTAGAIVGISIRAFFRRKRRTLFS